jgi:hypothetical protein
MAMATLQDATPRCSVWLFKTIDRQTIDGQSGVSARYQGKDPYIDLTKFLGDGSSVRTSKSVREPAGGWSITFMDAAQKDWVSNFSPPGFQSLETVYGLVEPMDVIEIRMWSGVGPAPLGGRYPIVMRGFVSEVHRSQTMGQDGRPQRQVTITGQDYGKIWQTFQVLHLPAYTEGKALLTSFAISELFDFKVVAALPAGEFIRQMVEKIINPHLAGFLPDTLPSDIPKKIQTGDSISVKHGSVNQSFQSMQSSVYEIMRLHGDVGIWNELYVEDREDGVHCVYRAIPALHLTAPEGSDDRKIQDDAPDPVYVPVFDDQIVSLSVMRTDSTVANFFWVNNSRFDLIDDMQRKLSAITEDNKSVSTRDYPNTAVKYYGVRPMYAETQQAGDEITNLQSGQPEKEQEARSEKQEAWIDRRRRHMMEMNRDNVVLERGTARIKGGIMRPDGAEMLKAGDYARFVVGRMAWDAYIVQVDNEFIPYQGYVTTLTFERGEGFARRVEDSSQSPWLVEQASRVGRTMPLGSGGVA